MKRVSELLKNSSVRILLVLIGVLSSLSSSTFSARSFDSVSQKQIQVVIIGVPAFAISKYNSTALSETITQRCQDIKAFFKGRFTDKQIAYHEYVTPETTTKESLRKLLEIDLPGIASGTLTFLFIISHGEIELHPNAPVSQDLRIVASDTTDTTERDFKFTSIPVATGLIPWMQKLSAGSTILTFLDTCHSGAASNKIVALSAELQQQLGVSIMVMASALPQQKAYNASFTAALLNLWNKSNGPKDCLVAAGMRDRLREEMKDVLSIPLSPEEGFATFIVEYKGPVCFNNFGTDGKLLFLYVGTAFPSASWVVYQEDTAGERKEIKVGSLDMKSFDLVRLDSGIYTVDLVKDAKVTHIPAKIDLQENPTEIIWLDTPSSLTSLGEFTRAMADLAEKSGLSSGAVSNLRLRAATSFLAVGDITSAQPLLKTLPPAYSNIPLVEKYSKVDISSSPSIEQIKKDFSSSASLLARTAETSMIGYVGFAREAYLMFGTAGMSKEAKQVRERFHLNFGAEGKDMIKAETKARESNSASSRQTFQILTTKTAVKNAASKSGTELVFQEVRSPRVPT